MALYEGRFDEVAQRAAARSDASVWFYEPKLTAAQAAIMRAQQLDLGEQDFDAALEKYDSARDHLLVAAQAARSDLTLLTQLNWVERQASSALIQLSRLDDASARVENLEEQLRTMRALDPEHPQLFRDLAELGMARYSRAIGDDPSPHLERAAAAYEEGIALDPNNIEAYCERSEIHLEIAAAANAHGRSPEPALLVARVSIEGGMARNPSFPALYLRQGEINLEQARAALSGTTARAAETSLALSRTALERARELHADDTVIPLRLAELCHLEGMRLLSRGTAVDSAVEEGLRWVATVLEINSNEARAYAARARLEILRAHALEEGPEHASALAAAGANAKTALKYNPLLQRELAPLIDRLRTSPGV